MARYRMTIAYDGTDFCGWQKQSPFEDSVPAALRLEAATADETGGAEPDAPAIVEGEIEPRARVELRTVQEVVERAVRDVVREPIVLMGASRTDSGVHARGQVGAFTCSEGVERGIGWPVDRGTEGLLRAVNSRLPRDVLVLDAAVAAENFNPIQGATSKQYSYTIWNSPTRPLWERRTALHIWDPLDVAKMQEIAALIEGEHNFAAFAAAGHGRLSTVRTVFACRVRTEDANGGTGASPGTVGANTSGDALPGLAPASQLIQTTPDARRIVIEVCGSGFLWNMVRIIAGTLVEAGRGRIGPERVREALRTGKRELAGATLQPQGLCLEWIRYE